MNISGAVFILYCMKKRLFCIFLSAVLTVLACGAVGCSDGEEIISERRSGYFSCARGGYGATAISGVREDPFEADGAVGDKKPYTLITLTPDSFDMDKVYTYSAKIGNSEFAGTMIVHPFAGSFSAEIECEATGDFIFTATDGKEKIEFNMISLVPSDSIDFSRAIEAGRTALHPSGKYEVRARVVKNPIGDGLCWHVLFISESGSKGVLLDMHSAKVLAKKDN